MSIAADWKIAKMKLAVGSPFEMQNRMADEAEHFFYLPFSAFMNGDFHQAVGALPRMSIISLAGEVIFPSSRIPFSRDGSLFFAGIPLTSAS